MTTTGQRRRITTRQRGAVACLLGLLVLCGGAPGVSRAGAPSGGMARAPQVGPRAPRQAPLAASVPTYSPCQPWHVVATLPRNAELTGVAAVSARDVWAVGFTDLYTRTGQPLIEHWDGLQWRGVPSPPIGGKAPLSGSLAAVTAISVHDVWAVGEYRRWSAGGGWDDGGPLIEHWDGHTWTIVPAPRSGPLFGVAATSAHDVWAVGTSSDDWQGGPQILHWDGRHWTTMAAPDPTPNATNFTLYGVAVTAPDDAWAVGGAPSTGGPPDWSGQAAVEHWDGHRWQLIPLPSVDNLGSRLEAVVALSARDVWAAGGTGGPRGDIGPLLGHWDGQHWRWMPAPHLGIDDGTGFTAMAASSAREVWLLNPTLNNYRLDSTPYSALWNGHRWYKVPGPASHALAVVDAHDLWGVGGIIVHTGGPPCSVEPIARTLPMLVGGATGTIVSPGGRAAVTGFTGTVSLIDASIGQILHTTVLTTSVGVPFRHTLASDASTGRIFVATAEDNAVRLLDGNTGAVLTTTTVGVYPLAVAVVSPVGRALVLNGNEASSSCQQDTYNNDNWICLSLGPGSVSVLDLASARVLTTTTLGTNPTQLAVDDQTARVFVADDAGLQVLDARSGQLLSTLPITPVTAIIDAPALGRVFVGVNTFGGGQLYQIDARQGTVTQVTDLPLAPRAMAVAEQSHRLYAVGKRFYRDGGVGYQVSDQLIMLDVADGRVLATASVLFDPSAVAVDEGTQRVFVTSWTNVYYLDQSPDGPSTVSVFDLRTLTPLAAFPINEVGARQLVVDPQAHRVLVDGAVLLYSGPPAVLTIPETPPTRQPGAVCCGASRTIQHFPRTGHTLSGAFLTFWRAHGGRATLGEPRTEPFVENAHWTQYTDRLAIALAEGQVQVLPLGRLLTAGQTFAPVRPFRSTATAVYFAATGHSLRGRFLTYWRTHQGAVLLGAPRSEVTPASPDAGPGTTQQWFENGRLEDHPLAGGGHLVQIGPAGREALQRRGWLP